jgi:gamma-glutamyltranspeptidase / glutathione hydrolase
LLAPSKASPLRDPRRPWRTTPASVIGAGPGYRSSMGRRAVAIAGLILTLVLPATAAAQSQAVATGTGGAAASVDRDATRTAIQILSKGGNAIDAAVAANATLGVTEPYVAGLGGGGFMTIYLADQHKLITIDGREKAPQAFQQDAFIDPATGRPIPFSPQRVTSGMAVGVPGTLAQWVQALDNYGTMSLSRLLRPAIKVARQGFVVDQTYHDQTESNRARLDIFSPSREYYLTPDLQAPAVGTVVRNPDLAKTYQLIAAYGPGAFYDGPIGAAVADTVQHPPVAPDANPSFEIRPGPMTTDDLRAYTAPQREPTHVTYRGLDVYGMPPPSSGGSTVGEALNILEGFDMSTSDRALALHHYLESTRFAFADRNRWVGDPDFFDVPLAGLLSKDFAAERRCQIGPTAATSPVAPGDPSPPYDTECSSANAAESTGTEGTSTNHLTVVDHEGNVVSYTSTIEQMAGSAIAVRGYGFLLNNELTDFDPAPPADGSPDPNLPAGGKRPRSSMAPTIVMKDGQPLLAVGSPGGATIITTVLQVLLNRFDFGMTLPEAIAAPRASQRNAAKSDAEPAFIAQYGNELSTRFGQSFNPTAEIGAATGVEFLPNGDFEAAAEPVRRGGGSAAVVCPDGQPAANGRVAELCATTR